MALGRRLERILVQEALVTLAELHLLLLGAPGRPGRRLVGAIGASRQRRPLVRGLLLLLRLLVRRGSQLCGFCANLPSSKKSVKLVY